jgi:hypothetical protein
MVPPLPVSSRWRCRDPVCSCAAAEQNDQDLAALDKVNAVTWAEMQTQLADAFADRFYVAVDAKGQSAHSHGDLRSGLDVPK